MAAGGTTASVGGASSGGAPSAGGAPASGGAPSTGGASDSGTGATGSGGLDGNPDDETAPSAGCGSPATLTDSPGGMLKYNELMSSGTTRRFVLRLPADYDETTPHRLILGLHGATGNANEVFGGGFFGLPNLVDGPTIFVAMEAVGGFWSAEPDKVYADDVLSALEADLCIDKNRVFLEGFSQGAAMSNALACSRPGVFRAVVAHSPGGVALPGECEPVAYMTSLGEQESQLGQTMTADIFATKNGCTVETLAEPPGGGHLCSDYSGCPDTAPVRFCPYDGGHTPSPSDAGQNGSWMPEEVWDFLSQF